MNCFYREGEYWTLVFNGQVARVRGTRGMSLLWRLLGRPGREMHVLDLSDLHTVSAGSHEPLLDSRGRRVFRDRIAELEAELDEADRHVDVERSAIARTELDAVVQELARASGLGGRDRGSTSDSERARVAATRAIRAAIDRIGHALPDLGLHLSHCVRTGTYCAYAPDPTRRVEWQLVAPAGASTRAAALPARLALEVEAGPRFAGRVEERRSLDEAWVEVQAGRSAIVLLAGEPGIGKTRLVAEFAASSNCRGAVIAYGRCDEELNPAFGPFADVLDQVIAAAPLDLLRAHVVQHGSQTGVMAPGLFSRVPAAAGRTSDAVADRGGLFRAATALIADVSRRTPLIVVLEDLHWSDGASLALLRQLVRADRGGLLLVGTYRESQVPRSHPLIALLAALRREPDVSRIHLTGLSRIEVQQLTADAGLDDATAEEVQARTGGNPFFVTEVLRGIQRGEVGLPEGIRETLVHRLEQLGDPATRLLRLVAVMGREFQIDDVVAVAGQTIDVVLEAMDAGVAAGLLVELPDDVIRFGFAHALIRDALYQDLARGRRAQLHQTVAEVLERLRPEDARLLAHHFGLSPMPAAASRAVHYSRLAAQRAREARVYEEAALAACQAVRLAESHLPEDSPLLAELLVLSGRAEIEDRRPDAGKAILRRALTLARQLNSAPLVTDVALAFGSLSIATTPDEVAEPVALLREAIGSRASLVDANHVRLLCALTRWVSFVAPRAERLELEARALAMARRLADETLVADALVAALYNRIGPPDAQEQLALAAELETVARGARDEEKRLVAVLFRAFALLQLADYPAAAAAEDEFLRTSAALHTAFFDIYGIAIRGRRACMAGDFLAAQAIAGQMANAAAAAGWDNTAPIGMQAELLWSCWHLQGRFDQLKTLSIGTTDRLGPLRAAVAELGSPGSAGNTHHRDTLDAAMADDRTPGWWFAVPLLVQLCVELGATAQAHLLYQQLLPWAGLDLLTEVQAFHGSVQHYLGLLATVTCRWPAAVDHFTDAVRRHEAAGSPPWVAISTAELGRALTERDRPGDAALGAELRETAHRSAASMGVCLRGQAAGVPT